MEIIVNDTSILIDLIEIDLFEDFLCLEYEFHTNVFIVNEIKNPEQRKIIDRIVTEGKLYVEVHKAEEYPAILSLKTKNLSFEDCSIWYYAKRIGGILLTGDAMLRQSAESSEIEVRGILFVFDQLRIHNIISPDEAIEKLELLARKNQRLPKAEIQKRVTEWGKNSE